MEIDLLNISKSYRYQNVLKNINYSFKKNKVYFIVGESGCGKSTLIKIIAGLIKDYKGKVLYDGKNIKEIEESYLKKHIISYIDQKSTLIDYLSINQNIDFLLNKKENKGSNKQFKSYSGGEKRRIATYVSSLKDSEVIIADEISSSLDKNNAILIMDYLRSIAKDKILIVVTHDKFLINESDIVINLANIEQRKRIINKTFRYKKHNDKVNYLNLFKYAFYKLKSKINYILSFLTSFMVGLTLILLISSLETGIISFLEGELLKNFNFDYLLIESKTPFEYGFLDKFNKISDNGTILMDDMYFDPMKNMIFTKCDDENVYFEIDTYYSMSKELFEYNDEQFNININGYDLYIKEIIDERDKIIHCPISFFEDYYRFKGYKINNIKSKYCVLKVNKDFIVDNYEEIQNVFVDYKFRNSGLESFVYMNNMLNKIKILLFIFIITSLLITFFLVLTVIKLDIEEDKEEIRFMKYSGLSPNYIFCYYLLTNYYRGFLTFMITLISYFLVITFSNTILRNQLEISYDILTIKMNSCIVIFALVMVIITICLLLVKKKIKV